jgi:hypothetical protein
MTNTTPSSPIKKRDYVEQSVLFGFLWIQDYPQIKKMMQKLTYSHFLNLTNRMLWIKIVKQYKDVFNEWILPSFSQYFYEKLDEDEKQLFLELKRKDPQEMMDLDEAFEKILYMDWDYVNSNK